MIVKYAVSAGRKEKMPTVGKIVKHALRAGRSEKLSTLGKGAYAYSVAKYGTYYTIGQRTVCSVQYVLRNGR
jgi:hypothetical protein